MEFFKKYGWALLLAAAFSTTFLWPGCSCGGDSGGSDKNPATQSNGSVVCADGEAWIMAAEVEIGYIFRPNGDVIAVEARENGGWYGSKAGTYSTAGNKLTLVVGGEESVLNFSVSGSTLTLTGSGNTLTYAKRTGVYVNV